MTSGSAKASAFIRDPLISLKTVSICGVERRSYRGQAKSTNPGIWSLYNPADFRNSLTTQWFLGLDILRTVSFLAFDSHLLPPLSMYPR